MLFWIRKGCDLIKYIPCRFNICAFIIDLSSVVKRLCTSVSSRYKKMKTSRYQVFFKYRWYRGPDQPASWHVVPYDFRDAENTDGIAEV